MLLMKGATVQSTANNELVFNLPMTESKNFPEMFELLENNKAKLNFLNLGISVTTMEDVFLR
jgi:ATP-binding cassette subfamily A (ABC1) protein 3